MAQARKRGKDEKAETKKTSLHIRAAVYRRAWTYKLDTGVDLGTIVSEALDEYLKKRGTAISTIGASVARRRQS